MLETDFKFNDVKVLADQVVASDDKVQFRGVLNSHHGGVSLLAFKAGQKLDEHLAPAELMVTVLSGEINFNIGSTPHNIKAGEFMLVGAGVAHSVEAVADSKVMLIKVKA
ncbi:MAG: cupin domain-containing protein [Muribaculaceae bacterium]|nr:cupin domain-containing protein [Muribaculaceae bacterium]MDE6295583.1 cupin domain-containing protein [Muribaculaceae bacterium]